MFGDTGAEDGLRFFSFLSGKKKKNTIRTEINKECMLHGRRSTVHAYLDLEINASPCTDRRSQMLHKEFWNNVLSVILILIGGRK